MSPSVLVYVGRYLQSVKRLNATLQWRREMKPEELVCRACAKDPRAHYCHLVGHCNQGRPVIYTCMELPNNRVYEDNRDHMIQVGGLTRGSGGGTSASGPSASVHCEQPGRRELTGQACFLPLKTLSLPPHVQTLLRTDNARDSWRWRSRVSGLGPWCVGAPEHAAGSASGRCAPWLAAVVTVVVLLCCCRPSRRLSR